MCGMGGGRSKASPLLLKAQPRTCSGVLMISLQQLDVIAHNASKDPCCCVTQLKLLLLFLEHALFKGCCLAEGNQLQFFTIITIVINIIISG